MENLIAIKTNCYKGFDLERSLQGIKKAGFKYLELSASPGNSSEISRFAPFDKLCELRALIKKYDLIPIGLGGHTNIMDEDLTIGFIDNIRLCNFFGCKYFVCSVGGDKDYDDQTVIDKLNYFMPYLEEYDVNIVIELHGKFATGEKLEKIVKGVNSKRVTINYDTANIMYYSGVGTDFILKDLENSVDLAGYFHIKDKLGERNEWNFPALGKGYIPLEEIFKIIDKHQNKSFMTVEIEFTPEGVKNAQEVDEAVLESAKYLKEHGFSL